MIHNSSTKRSFCRALLIEDNMGDVELIKKAVSGANPEIQMEYVSTLNDGMAALREGEWHVVLSDLSLPDSYGLETVRCLRREAPCVPMVVLTSLSSDDTALQALDEGAQDYLVKDNITTEILQRAIRYAIQRQTNSEMRRLIDQLRENEQLLEKKNRRLEKLYKTAHRFVDNVSHEFRTPLTVIKEYVSLVRDGVVGQLTAEQAEMLDVVSDRADDLNNMVDDMLDISKLETGMLGIWRKNCQVTEIISHIRPSLQRKSTVKSVEIAFDVPNDLPRVYCDDEKIGRVIVNLAINAIKFSGDPGKVLLWAKEQPARGEVIIGVTDNGPGISQDNLQAIFRRFKQIGGNPRGSTKGFGLGLNIAKELVDLNLGEIRVESRQGHGSTFSFTIPIAEPVEVVRRYLHKIPHLPQGSSSISLVRVRIEPSVDAASIREVSGFLNLVLRRNDLLFPIDPQECLLVLPLPERDFPRLVERIEQMRTEANQNRPRGQLPPLQLELVGRWNIQEQGDALLAEVERAVHGRGGDFGGRASVLPMPACSGRG